MKAGIPSNRLYQDKVTICKGIMMKDNAVVGKFKIVSTPISGLVVLERTAFEDVRGVFSRLYSAETLQEAGMNKPILQINHSITRLKGTARGLHFQYPPSAEMKVVTCLRGEVFDVAVDLRHGSDTFLSWHGEYLSESNRKSLLIPEGCAHGFQTMEENCELLYFHTANYSPEMEGGVNVEDNRIGIQWPLPIQELSARDRTFPVLDSDFEGINL